MYSLGVLTEVVEPGEATKTVALERAFPCVLSVGVGLAHVAIISRGRDVLPDMPSQMLAAGEAEVARWIVGAVEALTFLLLLWSAFTVCAAAVRAVPSIFTLGNSIAGAARASRSKGLGATDGVASSTHPSGCLIATGGGGGIRRRHLAGFCLERVARWRLHVGLILCDIAGGLSKGRLRRARRGSDVFRRLVAARHDDILPARKWA